jgi:hypothetical protein
MKRILIVLAILICIIVHSQILELSPRTNDDYIDILVNTQVRYVGLPEIIIPPGDTIISVFSITDTSKIWYIQGATIFSTTPLRASQSLGDTSGSMIYGGYIDSVWVYNDIVNTITPFGGGIGLIWSTYSSPYPMPVGLRFELYNPSISDTGKAYINIQLRYANNE